MKNIRTNFSYLMHISPEVDYFRENSFLTTAMLLLISAWLWVGQIVIKQSMTPLHGLLLFALMGLTTWLVYEWYCGTIFEPPRCFCWLNSFFAVMIYLLGNLELGYLLLFMVFTAGALVGLTYRSFWHGGAMVNFYKNSV